MEFYHGMNLDFTGSHCGHLYTTQRMGGDLISPHCFIGSMAQRDTNLGAGGKHIMIFGKRSAAQIKI
jgi:hypothetical protein